MKTRQFRLWLNTIFVAAVFFLESQNVNCATTYLSTKIADVMCRQSVEFKGNGTKGEPLRARTLVQKKKYIPCGWFKRRCPTKEPCSGQVELEFKHCHEIDSSSKVEYLPTDRIANASKETQMILRSTAYFSSMGRIGPYCYYKSYFWESWFVAWDVCMLYGKGTLVSIPTVHEDRAIARFLWLRNDPKPSCHPWYSMTYPCRRKRTQRWLHYDDRWMYWTSGNDVQREGIFIWRGTMQNYGPSAPGTYTNWLLTNRGNVPNGGKWDCMLYNFGYKHYGWMMQPCKKRYQWICEKIGDCCDP